MNQELKPSSSMVPDAQNGEMALSEDAAEKPLPPSLQAVKDYSDRAVGVIDAVSEKISPKAYLADEASPEGMSRKAILFGAWMFLVIFGIFGIWSVLAPINSAAIAMGQVVLDSNRKTIQHLEGGIIAEIYVREGDKVEEGDPLVRLDETAAKARLDLFRSQSIAARTTEARLLAERDNKLKIEFPDDLLEEQTNNPVVEENLDSQRRLFDSRRKNLEGQIAILQQKIKQYKEEITGLGSQKTSASSQLRLLGREINNVKTLVDKGLASLPRLLALEREQAAVKGQRGEIVAQISRTQQNIAEAEIQMINLRNEFLNEVVAELKDTQVQIADLEERIRTSADTVYRVNINAPISGTITGLKVHTVGGVIAPGEAVMDIVPQDDKLIIEARVQPQDIDVVRPDLEAQVRLNAYKARFVPPLQGLVNHVSADKFIDERTGEAYYSARIEIDHTQLEELEEVELYPGMPSDVLIVTGSRTLLSYLITPITDSFNHAFREE